MTDSKSLTVANQYLNLQPSDYERYKIFFLSIKLLEKTGKLARRS